LSDRGPNPPTPEREPSGPFSDVRIAIARRDIASLSREKTIVLALVIQLFIAAFSSFLVVGLSSLYNPDTVESNQQVTIAVAGEAAPELGRAADEAGVNVEPYATQEAALTAFQGGEVDTVVNAEFASGTIAVTASVPEGSIRSTLLVVQVRQMLEELERSERFERRAQLSTEPVPVPQDRNANPYFGFTYTILLPLLLFLPPFISGSVTVDAITEEIERGTLELLRVAPVSLTDVVDGKAIGMAALAPAQALLWILLLSANGIAIGNVLWLLVLVSAVALLTVTLGAVLALVLGTRRKAQLLYSVLALAAFGAAALLPEHPASTAAKLAVDSPTSTTFGSVAGLAVLAVVVFAAARRYVGSVHPERY